MPYVANLIAADITTENCKKGEPIPTVDYSRL